MRSSTTPFAILLVLLTPAVVAASGALTPFEAALGSPTGEMRFDRSSLGSLANALRPAEPLLADLIDGLESVETRQFTLQGEQGEAARAGLDDSLRRLKRDGWSGLVQVVDDKERIEVLVRTNGAVVEGVVVLFLDDREAGLARVTGKVPVTALLGLLPRMGNLRNAFDDLEEVLDGR